MEKEDGGGFVGVGRGGLVLWSISNMAKPDEAGEESGGGLGVILAASISNLENMGGGVGGRGRGVTVAEKDEGRRRTRCFSCYRHIR